MADPTQIGYAEKDQLQGDPQPSLGSNVAHSARSVANLGVRAAGAPGVDPHMLKLHGQLHAAMQQAVQGNEQVMLGDSAQQAKATKSRVVNSVLLHIIIAAACLRAGFTHADDACSQDFAAHLMYRGYHAAACIVQAMVTFFLSSAVVDMSGRPCVAVNEAQRKLAWVQRLTCLNLVTGLGLLAFVCYLLARGFLLWQHFEAEGGLRDEATLCTTGLRDQFWFWNILFWYIVLGFIPLGCCLLCCRLNMQRG